MCGIVGLIAKDKRLGFTYKAKTMFEDMLFADTLRGDDGTGIYTVNKYGNVNWAKEASEATIFLADNKARSILSDISTDGVFLVGHNRKATKGALSDQNSHPFIESNIILVHNGTLQNHKDLNASVEVDSHAIAHAMVEHGIPEAINKIHGAFAIIAYDINTKTLHIMRNNQRPLYIAESDDFFAFASEPWLIYGMGWRNDFKFKELIEVQEKVLFSYKIEDNSDKITLSQQPLTFYEPPKNPTLPTTFKGVQSGGSTTDNKTTSIFDWAKGDLVVFKPTSMQLNLANKQHKIAGNHIRNPKVGVVCYVDSSFYTEKDVRGLFGQQYLCACVKSVYYDSKSHKLFCEDLAESMPIVTRNGITLDEELYDKIKECGQCRADLHGEVELLADSYVKINNQGKIKVICPDCVEKNISKIPNWGKLNAQTQNCTV